MREGTLDHVAALVGSLIERRDFLAGRIGLDDRRAIPRNQEFAKLITVVGSVGQHPCGLRQLADQAGRRANIAHLPRGEIEGNQLAGSVGDGMNLGCTPAAAASDRLLLAPPFPPAAQRWAFEVVLSMLCDSDDPGSTSASSIVCQMPAFDHRLNRL